MNVAKINNYPVTTPAYYPAKSKNNNFHTNPLTENKSSADNVLADKNYGILQTKKMNVAFKGLPAVPAQTLGEKVANVFNILRSNDLIIASKNIDTAVNSMDKHKKAFKTVIKRVFFIEDKSLTETIGFKKNLENKEVMNLGNKPILIKDSKNQMGMLKNGESGYLMDGDTIKLGAKEIPFKEQEQTIFPIKNSFSAFIDFEKEVEPSIEQVNKNSIDKLKGILNKDKNAVPQQEEITFASVGGQAEAIKALKKNILYPIKHPELNGGNNMNKSVLLYGPPGTGKSLLAEATANEAGVWHKKINASELESKWVGESEKNWRDLFGEARENQPAIIFIDEFDAVAKKRGGHDVYGDKTLNTVLGLMSDAEKRGDEIYMIAATNNKAALDEAAIRSGRFGIAIEVGAPDLQGVKQTLDIYTKTQPMAKDFNYDAAADKIHKQKATGADIASITKDARNNAIEREQIYDKMEAGTYKPEDMKKLKIKNEDFDKAIETFAKSKNETKKPINPIGFNSPIYNK